MVATGGETGSRAHPRVRLPRRWWSPRRPRSQRPRQPEAGESWRAACMPLPQRNLQTLRRRKLVSCIGLATAWCRVSHLGRWCTHWLSAAIS